MQLKIKRLHPDAHIPFYATEGSAGMDLFSVNDEELILPPLGNALVPTGIAVSIPKGYAAFIFARSGLAVKFGINLRNGVGVIDSDYRGEIKVGLCNISDKEYTVRKHDRIAQMVIMPAITAEISECEDLDETERGSGGFGSTGK